MMKSWREFVQSIREGRERNRDALIAGTRWSQRTDEDPRFTIIEIRLPTSNDPPAIELRGQEAADRIVRFCKNLSEAFEFARREAKQ